MMLRQGPCNEVRIQTPSHFCVASPRSLGICISFPPMAQNMASFSPSSTPLTPNSFLFNGIAHARSDAANPILQVFNRRWSNYATDEHSSPIPTTERGLPCPRKFVVKTRTGRQHLDS